MPERQIVRFSTRKLSLVEIWRESLNLLRLRDFAAARTAPSSTATVAGVPREAPSRARRTHGLFVSSHTKFQCVRTEGWLAAALLRSIESTRDEFLGTSPLVLHYILNGYISCTDSCHMCQTLLRTNLLYHTNFLHSRHAEEINTESLIENTVHT